MRTTSWYEFLIEGPEESVREALAAIQDEGEQPVLGSELALHACSFPERILDFLRERTHQIVFVPAAQARELAREIEERPEIRLEHLYEVVEGRFDFHAETYSRETADRIREAVHGHIPPGVRLEGFEESELRDPEAKGVELYTTVHDYTYKASGRFVGSPPGIFELHQRLREIDFVKEDELEIEGREISLDQVG